MRAAILAVLLLAPATAGAQAMIDARAGHAAVTLADGRVLVAGGRAEDGRAIEGAEILERGRWRATGALAQARSELALTLLDDGRVLATGGFGDGPALAACEVWDPRTGAWSPAPPMAEARAAHVAVRLDDGRVLVAGGSVGESPWARTSAELRDRSGAWHAAGAMAVARAGGSAARLGDGSVIVSGSFGLLDRADDLDRFDPRTGAWSIVRGSLGAIEGVVALADGRALVLGHARPSRYVADSRDARAAIWDPASGAWSDAGAAPTPSWPRGLVLALAGGRVIAAGGTRWRFPSAAARDRAYEEACEGVHVPTVSVADVFAWSPGGGWSRAADLRQPRAFAPGAATPGALLVLGGEHRGHARSALRRSVERVVP